MCVWLLSCGCGVLASRQQDWCRGSKCVDARAGRVDAAAYADIGRQVDSVGVGCRRCIDHVLCCACSSPCAYVCSKLCTLASPAGLCVLCCFVAHKLVLFCCGLLTGAQTTCSAIGAPMLQAFHPQPSVWLYCRVLMLLWRAFTRSMPRLQPLSTYAGRSTKEHCHFGCNP